jgi:hypothetical protein
MPRAQCTTYAALQGRCVEADLELSQVEEVSKGSHLDDKGNALSSVEAYRSVWLDCHRELAQHVEDCEKCKSEI